MNRPLPPSYLFALCLSLFLLASGLTSSAQYAPPPPPPYPPPSYPPPQYPPQRPDYPPQSQRPVYPRYNNYSPYLSLYAMFSAGHYSGLGVGNGTPPTQSGGMTALGGTFGGYVLYPTPGPIHLGLDARLLVENSANSTQYGNKILGGLVGVRIDGSGAPIPVDPYFQFEIGGVGTNNGTSSSRSGSFAYQAQFGADIPFATDQVAARIEYGTGQLTGGANHTLQTFSAGIVLHFR
ncbi:MAG TPA: hypothetical protein VG714_10665 [Acidobacteriaceae bacterium]|nr:hypothetical protein [Acidobacteriaceae bacterium]